MQILIFEAIIFVDDWKEQVEDNEPNICNL